MQESTPAWRAIQLAMLISLPGSMSFQVKNQPPGGFVAQLTPILHDHGVYWFISTEEEAADAMDSMETKYTDIIIYVCGFLALIMATIIVVLCRMQAQPRGEPFDALPVQKLSKFPLRRQV